MHSDESGATPDEEVRTARLRAASVLLAIVVVPVTLLGSIVCAAAIGTARSGLAVRATTGLWIGGVLVAGLAIFLVERRLRQLRDRNRILLESAVRKDEFLASVSHELRTPLNVVLGYIDLLLDHSFGPLEPAQHDILHRITKNASNLSHLINDLVDLSRIEAGRMGIEMEVVDLGPFFADLTAVMEVLLAGHDVTFHVDIGAGCPPLHADPDRLKQIVSNLLVNAVKFTEKGTITLSARASAEGRVLISVTDTGIGIPSADQCAIFEPFRQAHDREHRAPGAGIGLAISSRLAVLMGGRLSVESAPGRGSRFTLALDAPPANESPGGTTLLRKVS